MASLPSIPKLFDVVEMPDHPFVADGPDFLVSGRPGLLAIFRPRHNHQESYSELIARLTSTLIAYPPQTLMALLLDPRRNNSPADTFENRYFHHVLEQKDLRYTAAMLRRKSLTGTGSV